MYRTIYTVESGNVRLQNSRTHIGEFGDDEMGLKLHVGDNVLNFHALHAHIRPQTRCQKSSTLRLSVRFVSATLNLDPKTRRRTTLLNLVVYR